MSVYISFLRGINVSGQKPINMKMLKGLYESIGFQKVVTYLQSGNVVYESMNEDTRWQETQITEGIKRVFGHDVNVMVLPVQQIERIIEQNPFDQLYGKPTQFIYFTLLDRVVGEDKVSSLLEKCQEGETVAIAGNTIYLYCPQGYGRTKLTNGFIESKFKVTATTRNWNTMHEVLRIASEL